MYSIMYNVSAHTIISVDSVYVNKTKVYLMFQSESYDTLLGFNLVTYRSCKVLWKSCVEHHTFFRLHSPLVRRRRHLALPLSSLAKYSYPPSTELQGIHESRLRATPHRTFIRSVLILHFSLNIYR
jgi:hypothetical protein